HDPQIDPFKGLKGMMAGIMIMEALAVFLILPTIGKLWDGKYASGFNMTYIAVLAVAMTVASFLQFRSFADPMNIVLQVLLLIGGIVVHPIVFIVAVLFIAAWWYTYYLRGHLKQRMERGLLPAQHVWVDENKDSRM
ncbi:MAG: DUF4233 domain-containing protein, partial [Corynebacterium variabile]